MIFMMPEILVPLKRNFLFFMSPHTSKLRRLLLHCIKRHVIKIITSGNHIWCCAVVLYFLFLHVFMRRSSLEINFENILHAFCIKCEVFLRFYPLNQLREKKADRIFQEEVERSTSVRFDIDLLCTLHLEISCLFLKYVFFWFALPSSFYGQFIPREIRSCLGDSR